MKFLKLFSIHLLFSFLFIFFYQQTFGFRTKLIAYHLLLILCFHLVLFIIGALLYNFDVKLSRWIYSLVWTGYTLFLFTTYGFAWIGKSILNVPLSIQILWVYLKDIGSILHVLRFPKVFIVSLALVIPIGIFYFYYAVSPLLLIDTRQIRLSFYKFLCHFRFKNPMVKSITILGIGSLFLLLLILAFRSDPYTRLLDVYEPITQVMLNERYIGGTSLRMEPVEIRTQYPHLDSFKKRNIILIIVDALRADYLPMYGYANNITPFLNELYQLGKLKKINPVFATSANSYQGILSILRSKSVHHLDANNFAIQDLLHDQGYRTHFILSGEFTHYYGLKKMYGHSVDYFFDGNHSNKYGLNDDLLVFEGLQPLIGDWTVPSFNYIHLMTTHELGILYHDQDTSIITHEIPLSDIQATYVKKVHQIDHYIHRLFDSLQVQGILDSSLVIITSDHGESLGERGLIGHTHRVYTNEIRTPLLIYDQDTSYHYDTTRPAIQPDIAVTIIDRLGLPIPLTWEGKSLLRQESHLFSFHQQRDHYAIIAYQKNRIFKYLYNSSTGKEEYYDLRNDLYEQRDLMDSIRNSSIHQELKEKMKDFVTHSVH